MSCPGALVMFWFLLIELTFASTKKTSVLSWGLGVISLLVSSNKTDLSSSVGFFTAAGGVYHSLVLGCGAVGLFSINYFRKKKREGKESFAKKKKERISLYSYHGSLLTLATTAASPSASEARGLPWVAWA
jgi:hypothetical protein